MKNKLYGIYLKIELFIYFRVGCHNNGSKRIIAYKQFSLLQSLKSGVHCDYYCYFKKVPIILHVSSWQMVYCSLTDFQKAVYQTVLETKDMTLILQSSEPCSCSSGRKRRNCCYKASISGWLSSHLAFDYIVLYSSVRGKEQIK